MYSRVVGITIGRVCLLLLFYNAPYEQYRKYAHLVWNHRTNDQTNEEHRLCRRIKTTPPFRFYLVIFQFPKTNIGQNAGTLYSRKNKIIPQRYRNVVYETCKILQLRNG